MRGIFFGLAACVLGLMAASDINAAGVVRKTVVAHGGHGSYGGYRGGYRSTPFRGHSHGRSIGGAYYRTHGARFSGGYYYGGRAHHHWGHRVWMPSARCYHYWDPNLNCYYYYDAVRLGYYPVVGGGVIIR